MMIAGAEATAARAQPSGKGGNIAETLSNPVCLRRIFTACILEGFEHILFLLTMFIKENILK